MPIMRHKLGVPQRSKRNIVHLKEDQNAEASQAPGDRQGTKTYQFFT